VKSKTSKANFWGLTMANGWTPERRAQQSALIRNLRPWEKSTGPRTPEGKARVSRNAYKGGARELLRELRRVLRKQARALHAGRARSIC
jgi:hypothetical protein